MMLPFLPPPSASPPSFPALLFFVLPSFPCSPSLFPARAPSAPARRASLLLPASPVAGRAAAASTGPAAAAAAAAAVTARRALPVVLLPAGPAALAS